MILFNFIPSGHLPVRIHFSISSVTNTIFSLNLFHLLSSDFCLLGSSLNPSRSSPPPPITFPTLFFLLFSSELIFFVFFFWGLIFTCFFHFATSLQC